MVKSIIKKMIGRKNNYKYGYSKKISSIKKRNLIKEFMSIRIFKSYKSLFSKVFIKNENNYFMYTIDIEKTIYHEGLIIENLMIDYNFILNNSLEDLENKINKIDHDSNFYKREKDLIDGLKILIDREIELTTNSDAIDSLLGIKTRHAESFKDALQRILFLNQILWQTNHHLNGLGRLDLILDSYYKNDLKEKRISEKEVHDLIKEFLHILHKDFYYKSSALAGDTGQIIILGGIDKNGRYFSSDLTCLFIEILEELNIPDPKVLLRVSNNIPKKLIEVSLKCISTGIGCPLFANDNLIIPRLIEFGYDEDDSYNYGTAACWEPYIPGKSFDQSNMCSISFMEPMNRLLMSEKLSDINSFNSLLNIYYKYLDTYLLEIKNDNDNKKYSNDAILSLFSYDCIEKEKDISCGGAIYNNYGFTGVGLSNLINSLLVVEKYVFNDKKYSLEKLNSIRNNNFQNDDELLKRIKNEKLRYGVDDERVISLTNKIVKNVTNFFANKKNPMGGKYKFGLSAPSYIMLSKDFPASLDGRKNGEPFSVHISNDKANGYTELVSFASKIDYGDNRINGNVVDFFVTPNFIKDNFDKFVDFLIISIKKGFFEMQMNVVSSKQLIDARNNPEKYSNLIVRVWGFSAYFNDLPDEYKDYLIERALKNEGNC